MRVDVMPDAARACGRAAELIASALEAAVAGRGRAAVAVSGGTTPLPMLEALARMPLPWYAVHLFQVDERVVEREDPARNLRALDAAFSGRGLPAANLHPLPVEAVDSDAALRAFAAEMRATLGHGDRLDVVHLGLGSDGHTASLMPGDAALASPADAAVTAVHAGHHRMTLTLGPLNRARLRLWLVTGAGKRGVLGRLLAGDAALVAGRVRRDASIIVADAAAAGDAASVIMHG